MDAKRGEIVDYEVKDADGNVTDVLPMLVVHVNDQDGGDGTVVGTVFGLDGKTSPVTIPKEEEPEKPTPEKPAETEADVEASFDRLSDDDKRSFFRDELARLSPEDRAALLGPRDVPSEPTPEPTPPATPGDQTPSVPASTSPTDAGTDGQSPAQ